MATIVKYLKFTIHLTNKANADALQAQYPGGVFISPDQAAATYAAPVQLSTADFHAPCVRSEFIVATGGQNFPTNTQQFTRKVGGWFGIPILFGTTYNYRWYGMFAWSAGDTAEIGGVPTEVVAIAQRKFIIGFEVARSGEAAASYDNSTRDASRHCDGFGWAYRKPTLTYTATTTDNGAVVNNKKTWERLYIRIRALPTIGASRIWMLPGTNGVSLRVGTDGRLGLYRVAGVAPPVDTLAVSTSAALEVNRWYRLDILLEYHATAGKTFVYINRELAMSKTWAAGTAISNAFTHTSSMIGDSTADAAETFECDFDDWIASEWPSVDSLGRYVGLDWLNGSKVQRCEISSYGTGNGWTGDSRGLNNSNGELASTSVTPTITVVSADSLVLNVSTPQIKAQLGSLGAVCFKVALLLRQQSSIAGSAPTLGWKFDGLIDLAGITQIVGATDFQKRMYRPLGLLAPIEDLTPFEIRHIKHGNISQADCFAASVQMELIGTFGQEDVPEDEAIEPATIPPRKGIHVAPYPESQWARIATPVVSPVIVHSGTYVGNGTVTELQFRAPVTWLLIKREASGGSQGSHWWSTQWGQHPSGAVNAFDLVRCSVDPSFVPTGVEDSQEQRYIVRINGASTALNAVANNYNYIAFEDPGARFSMNGAFWHPATVPTFANELWKSTFLPDVLFVQRERVGTDATFGLYMRGPGHTASNGSPLNAAEVATFGSFAAGLFTSGATFNLDDSGIAYAGFRADDGSSDPNKHKILKVGTYTGDGTASRTVSWEATGLRPLYVIVVPHNASAIHRTPSNTGTQSDVVGTGNDNVATGITAGGIDQFSVGSALNANGIVHDWFVILGGTVACNNGFSCDGEFIYIEPDQPEDEDDDIDDPEEPDEPPDEPDLPDDDDDCDASITCVEASTRTINLALLEIGSIQVLTNYCTQDTKEAVIARRIYEQCCRHTLITYPWPFATKYAVLALTATQPSNQDWTYSYRTPADCIFPRRIVVARGTAVDPSPPPMGLSSDANGGVILCNEPNAVLEYTCRPTCVGLNGDDLFREAFKWRLAAAFAPPLTRIPGEADRCLKMFEVVVQKAESVVKQGVPGLRPAAGTLDVSAAAIAANIQVVNMALVKIGSRTIANLGTEQTREAVAANLVFEDTLRTVLRAFPWAFATRYLEVATLVDGSEADPATPDWTFSHRLPTDFVFLRRLVLEGTGRSFDPDPYPYRLGSDTTGGLLYSNVEEPVLEYTGRIQNLLVYADAVFREALSWKLAATLAPSLASVELHRPEQHGRGPETPQDPTRRIGQRYNDQTRRVSIAQWANAMYERTLIRAEVDDRNESQPEPHADAEWIRGRQ